MAPPQESGAGYRQTAVYATEPKRMRLSMSSRPSPAGSSTTTRAATGAPTAMTNKGSVYKAQRGRAVTAAAVKAKAPAAHRRRGRKGKSVYRGVCVTREGKWRAVIYKERKQLYLGVYESEVEAAKAHDRAARFHFAENAVCNFDSEHEADRQAAIHQQRQLIQQQQLVEDRAHAQLHGGSFSVGREEFDDLEEYHRGLDEACSSEEDEREDADGDGEDCAEEDEEDDDDEPCTRSSRSMSSSSMSTGSISDDYGQAARDPRTARGMGCAGAAAPEQAFYARPPPAPAAPSSAAAQGAPGASVGCDSQHQRQQQRGRCSSGGASSCESDSDFAGVTTALLREAEPLPQEGMGFPYAEDLLGYEMQSWYCCQDEDDKSPPGPGSVQFQSQLQQQQPFMGRPQRTEELWGATSVGANLGWGFGDFAQAYSDGGSRTSSGSMSSSSLSCDDDYVPSALPPLMGMSAEP